MWRFQNRIPHSIATAEICLENPALDLKRFPPPRLPLADSPYPMNVDVSVERGLG
ncbi:hypothetical protein GGTG_06559 [Gaeumannomyces tritici R3-111a-1]|uniref:Uncharacterized protein n=1 Tax=Gaeumannomyces tritici (strain R3-111a-1) TaxID=644352 RepID=J3NZ59_GAET3|nr:hypothetical protein GGTG_06559 [Gaeumannomyces tritici R3-111a-1]EJT76642.1 hypothetical protein GGTG_06559 [Gaeumannomyces tritici R3-111a-1]